MEELLENLLYGATFPAMDKWRNFSAAPEPPECVMRVFVNVELRLQQRYGVLELDRLVQEMAVRRFLKEKPAAATLIYGGVALYMMLASGKHFAAPSARN